MKKLMIFGAAALVTGIAIISCQKEAVNPGQTTQTNSIEYIQRITAGGGGAVKTETHAYKWVGDKLDCSAAGKGCEVSAKIVSSTETIDLSVLQVLELMKIGNFDLNDYFMKHQNDLREIFPEVYETTFIGDIATNKINLVFEFPYLLIYDGQGTSQSNLVQAINYEASLSDKDVISALLAAAPVYDKVAQLNTDTSKPVVWICTNPGTNCATKAATTASSTFRFYPEWIRDNYQYLYVPAKDPISKSVLTKDRQQLELTTTTNDFFVVIL